MSNAIVGIDVSKKHLSIAIILGSKIHQFDILNDRAGFKQFSQWLTKYNVVKVKACMEATGSYEIAFAEYLHRNNHEVSIINPVCIKSFAKSKLSRHKADKVDSLIIAEYASKYDLKIYTPKDPIMLELKDLYKCIQNLKYQQQQINNLLEHKAHMSNDVCKSYNKVYIFLAKEIIKIEEKIDLLLQKNDNLRKTIDNITTIPGIGKTTAIATLAELPPLSLFKNARQVAAFAGLTPKHHTSGTSINKQARVSKIGSKNLRKILYFPAIVAKKHNVVFRSFVDRMTK